MNVCLNSLVFNLSAAVLKKIMMYVFVEVVDILSSS